jgi:hypothetical protein
MALWVFFFPWTCEAGEEEDFFIDFSLPLSLKSIKKTPTINPLV